MLRRRIMLISCAALLVSLAVSAFVMYRVCFDTLHREALNTAYAEAHEKTVAFDAFASSVKGELGKAEAKYYFESLGDSYTVCLREGAELYNRTVISSDELMAGEYQRYNDMEYRECRAAGRHVLVFHCDGMQSTELYRIADITYIYEKGERLGLFMLFVPAAVAAVCLVVLFILLRRMLSPLRELSASACAVAAGDYGKRVRAVSHDELGQLARDFNTMAQAVEEHTSELVDSQQKKTMFIGALTHELKTPLTAISGYAHRYFATRVCPRTSARRRQSIFMSRHADLTGCQRS